MVVTLVMTIGRMRVWPASTMASSNSRPARRFWLMRSTRIMASLTVMPASMMTPMKDMMLKGMPSRKSRSTAPTPASGMVRRMTKGCSRDSNWAAMTM